MSRKITNEEVIEKLKIKNPKIILINDFLGMKNNSNFKCLICDNSFKANSYNIINGISGCSICSKIDTKKFTNKVNEIHNFNIKVLGEYVNNKTKIEVICNICDYKWFTEPRHLIAGNKCLICTRKNSNLDKRKTHDDFIKKVKSIHHDRITILEEYVNWKTKIQAKCNKCEHIWSVRASSLHSSGCPKCKCSKGELLIDKILRDLQLKYIYQYKFEGLKTEDDGSPTFDFVILDKENKIKKVIEYDGEQHFKPIKKWGGIKRIEQQKKTDNFKNNFCLKNNIEIIRIPYTDLKKIDNNYIKNLISY